MTTKLDVLLVEIDEMRKAKESMRGALTAMFGVVLPGLISIFTFAADKADRADRAGLATLFIVASSLSSIWAQILWIEYLTYVRYYYLQLLPRVYVLSKQEKRPNYLESTFPRTRHQMFPIVLFNSGCFTVFMGAYLGYVKGKTESIVQDGVCLVFIAATVVSIFAVFLELRSLAAAIVTKSHGTKEIGSA